MNRLRQAVDDYLTLRRALGLKLREAERLLTNFLDYLERTGSTTITIVAAVDWATSPPSVGPARAAARLGVVRSFARHLHCLDPSTEVPPEGILTCPRIRPTPYLYSERDIARLVDAAGAVQPALRGATYYALFGLIAVTGMRIGEAIHLNQADVDLANGVMEINDAKFRKQRRLPLHRSTVVALQHYANVRDELCPTPKGLSFFVSMHGTRLIDGCVHRDFRTLVNRLGLEPQPGARDPQIHGLRHSFAVSTLRDWHREGADPTGKVSLLAAYLGHTRASSTYWYLQACPELLAVAAERLDIWEREPR